MSLSTQDDILKALSPGLSAFCGEQDGELVHGLSVPMRGGRLDLMDP